MTESAPSSSVLPVSRFCIFISLITSLASFALGVSMERHQGSASTAKLPAPVRPTEPGIPLKSGPWGEIYRTPFSISAPEELLPVRRLEESGTRWRMPGRSRADAEQLIQSMQLPADQRTAWLSADVLKEDSTGVLFAPPADLVIDLPATARDLLYRELSRFTENSNEIYFLRKDTISERFGNGVLNDHAVNLFHKLSCDHNDYLVFSGLPAMLSQLPEYQEKLHLVRALTRQRTMTLRLVIRPGMDVSEVANYWEHGMWASDVRTILESISHTETGGSLDVISMLPPLPSSQLYIFPKPDNPLNGPSVVKDCHWSAFNFFNEEPDAQFSDPKNYLSELRAKYSPIVGDPRFGDLMMVTKPDGTIIHSMIFIADDVVYTKNGSSSTYPWMLSTIEDVIHHYGFANGEGGQPIINTFRKKTV